MLCFFIQPPQDDNCYSLISLNVSFILQDKDADKSKQKEEKKKTEKKEDNVASKKPEKKSAKKSENDIRKNDEL